MLSIFSLILAITFSNMEITEAFDPTLNIPTYDPGFFKKVKELQEEKKRHREALDAANEFSEKDFNRLIENKKSDLRSINAILTRYKEDFTKVREQNDQDGRYTKHKVEDIFKLKLYEYEPDKNLWHLAHHIFSSFHDSTTDKEAKLLKVEERITTVKKSLFFMRDLAIRKEVTPFKIFVYLYHMDIYLAILRGMCQNGTYRDHCQNYYALLSELDNL